MATIKSLSIYEQENGVIFPEVYRKFFMRWVSSVPASLIGTDMMNTSDLTKWAAELLQENGIRNFLNKKDFVFMMHQGYMFWFFRADGNPNPVVFGYSEVDKQIKNLGHLEDFLKQYQ